MVNLLVDLQRDLGLSYLFISHDLSVIQHIAQRVLVMYLGKIVESAPRALIWSRPLHPYTQALIAAVPVPDPKAAKQPNDAVIEGEIPSPIDPPSGCRFRTRCPFAAPLCVEREPLLREVDDGSFVACHFVEHAPDGSIMGPGYPGVRSAWS